MQKSCNPFQGADFPVRNFAANELTAHNREFLLSNAKFSAISAENSKVCCISSLSAESLEIAMKAPESRLATDDGLKLSRGL
jgi:hypothetical protein